MGHERDAWLGIDLGTQSVRVLLVTADGTVLGAGSAPLERAARRSTARAGPGAVVDGGVRGGPDRARGPACQGRRARGVRDVRDRAADGRGRVAR